MDLVPDFKAYYDVWMKPDDSFKILLENKADEKFSYKSQNTLSEDLEKLKNNKQSTLNNKKIEKKDKEKISKELKKNINKNKQDLDKIENDLKTLNTSDPDYKILKDAKLELEDKINSDEDEKKSLRKIIGTLDSEIGGLKTNIRNISSAMKTLTLGAY